MFKAKKMIERVDTISCCMVTPGNRYLFLPLEPEVLLDIYGSEVLEQARNGKSKMVVGYNDELGQIHETQIVNILVPYYFGLYLEHRD